MDSNINNEIRMCLIATFQYKLFIKLAQRKDSKQRIGYGCIYHFFSLEFLYADTDSAEIVNWTLIIRIIEDQG